MPFWKLFEMRALNPCGVAFPLPCKLQFNIFSLNKGCCFVLPYNWHSWIKLYICTIGLFHFLKHCFVSPTTTHTFDDLFERLRGPKEGYTHVQSRIRKGKDTTIADQAGIRLPEPSPGTSHRTGLFFQQWIKVVYAKHSWKRVWMTESGAYVGDWWQASSFFVITITKTQTPKKKANVCQKPHRLYKTTWTSWFCAPDIPKIPYYRAYSKGCIPWNWLKVKHAKGTPEYKEDEQPGLLWSVFGAQA